ncbi:hypothetical protein TRVL_07849 [Trypanosoma vivax]|nr:hypothetical protein TRVL_07849 [Trypanosoma vivax]
MAFASSNANSFCIATTTVFVVVSLVVSPLTPSFTKNMAFFLLPEWFARPTPYSERRNATRYGCQDHCTFWASLLIPKWCSHVYVRVCGVGGCGVLTPAQLLGK